MLIGWVLGLTLGTVWLYFWIKGNAFAALLGSPIGLLIGGFATNFFHPPHEELPVPVCWAFLVLGLLSAWVPCAVQQWKLDQYTRKTTSRAG